MRLSILLLAAIAFAPVAFAADGNFDRTLTVSGSPTLNISNGSGYVHVYSGAPGQIHIVGHVHSHMEMFSADSEQRVKEISDHPPISQSGNIVLIRKPEDSDLFRNISVDYDITAPASTTLTSHTGSGSMEIGGIQGSVTADTGSGSIHADNIAGNAHLQTGSGSITASGVHGGASVQTGSGHITLTVTSPGDIRAHTGSGGIELDGISGSLQADTGSGSIEVEGNPTSDWRVHTGSGGVHLRIPGNARFNLDAHTGSGGIHMDRPLTIQGSSGKHSLSGPVNGGGPTVRVGTGSGGVTIQ